MTATEQYFPVEGGSVHEIMDSDHSKRSYLAALAVTLLRLKTKHQPWKRRNSSLTNVFNNTSVKNTVNLNRVVTG